MDEKAREGKHLEELLRERGVALRGARKAAEEGSKIMARIDWLLLHQHLGRSLVELDVPATLADLREKLQSKEFTPKQFAREIVVLLMRSTAVARVMTKVCKLLVEVDHLNKRGLSFVAQAKGISAEHRRLSSGEDGSL